MFLEWDYRCFGKVCPHQCKCYFLQHPVSGSLMCMMAHIPFRHVPKKRRIARFVRAWCLPPTMHDEGAPDSEAS